MLKQTIELAKTKVPEGILVVFLALIGYFAAQIWHSISAPILQHILPAIPGSILMSLSLLLCLLLLASFAYIFHLHHLLKTPKELGIFQDELWLARDTGIGVHKTTKETYCYVCAMKNIKAPLRRGEKMNDWVCVHCGIVFDDPFGATGQYANWLEREKKMHNKKPPNN
jgi:hypothetical protein